MTKITDNFCGYLNVDEDVFAYNALGHVVTLLPAQSNEAKRYEVLDRIRSRSIDLPEFLFGVCDNNYRIAMLRNSKFRNDSFGLNPSIQFGTPIIIKATGNLAKHNDQQTHDWRTFHGITFCGGNINAICNPGMAVERLPYDEYIKMNSDGAREIKIKPWDDYTRSIDIDIDGEKASLTVSVMQTGESNNSENMNSYKLGELNSFMRFTFKNAQCFEKIEKYYGIAKSLVAILTTRNNVFFDVYLSQRTPEDQLIKTCICKVFDNYENYSTKKFHNVIPIYSIFENVPKLIKSIANNEVGSLLALLPEDNKRANQISITNIQDLCTALEVAYNWSERGNEKDNLISELKIEIKKTVAKFAETHDDLDTNKKTTISSAFQYLDYTLKDKVLTLYSEHCNAVVEIISKWSLPQMDDVNVQAFVKLRNNKTHSGTIEWGNSADIYTPLLALTYACLFSHIGLCDEKIRLALLQIF